MSLPLQDPTLIDDRYRLDVELGAGAFGSVYKAVQMVMGKNVRTVALKLFHADTVSSDTIQELMNDAVQILAVLSDLTDWEIRQHFVTVYDLGVTREETPRGYVSMELVRGGSLEGRLRDLHKFTIPNAFHYLHQIARAMAFMHERQFVHSDLKPPNILVFRGRENDLIKLGDFGLAGKYVGPLAEGPRGGTMSYMAPEALGGFATTPACDVFSMGVMAHEMLTGDNPYNQVGRTLVRDHPDYDRQFHEMHQMSREVPLSLKREDFPELTGALEHYIPMLDVVNRMLTNDIGNRYVSAGPAFRDLDLIRQKRLPELGLGGASASVSEPAVEEAEDPVQRLMEEFKYHVAKHDWGQAIRTANQVVKQARHRAVGYQLRSAILRQQADQVEPSQPPQANRFRGQAINWLNRGLNACQSDSEQRQLWRDIADTHQEMGDHATAQQIRSRTA
ncbi:MAG: serine/threonine protein kinase [Pirellulaceae bacterium]